MEIWHVYPINDLEEHTLDHLPGILQDDISCDCKCCPTIKFENGDYIIVHNSYDGREGLEEAKEILGL